MAAEEEEENMRGAIMASLKTPVVSYKGIGLPRGFLLLLCVPLIALLCFQLPSSLDDGSPPQNQESAHAVPCTSAENGTLDCAALHRSLFPQRFVFGTATAAYQVCSNILFIYIFACPRVISSSWFAIFVLDLVFNLLCSLLAFW